MPRGIYPLYTKWCNDNEQESKTMLPEVLRDSNGYFYPHVVRERTGHQRMRIAYGTIKNLDALRVGKTPSDSIRDFIRPLGIAGDHAGHIIPMCLNGSGSHRDNFFPQHARVNQGLGSIEKKRKRDMREGGYDLQFVYIFTYPDDEDNSEEYDDESEGEEAKKYPKRPISIIHSVQYFKDGKTLCEATYVVLNPIGNRYAIILAESDVPELMSFEEFFKPPNSDIVGNGMCQTDYLSLFNLLPPKQGPKIIGNFTSKQLPDRSFFTQCVQLSVMTGLVILTARIGSTPKKPIPNETITAKAPPRNMPVNPASVPKNVPVNQPPPNMSYLYRAVKINNIPSIQVHS